MSLLDGARTLVRDGLMQNDLDADNHQILNLDTSNLVISGIPNQPPVAHKWFNSYDSNDPAQSFGISQPAFLDISGSLSILQQRAITHLGLVVEGTWSGNVINANKLPQLNFIHPPIADVTLNNHKITNLADAVNPQDAVNLRTVNQLTGLNPKAAVAAASSANIAALVGLLTIDGVVLSDGNRVLVKDQITANSWQNGIYNAHVGAWTRTSDFDGVPTDSEMVGASVFVLGGTVNAITTWFQITPSPIILINDPDPAHPHAPSFVLISTGSDIAAGVGLTRVGNTISAVGTANRISIGAGINIDAAYVGQLSITTLGTITTGNWNGSIIPSQYGGTGVNNDPFTITIEGAFAITGGGLSLHLIGATDLTLPQVGTLATLSGNETFINKHINASQIDTGTLPIARGGTGQVTASAAINALLPNQAGHAGQKLTTDGAGNLSWT